MGLIFGAKKNKKMSQKIKFFNSFPVKMPEKYDN